MNQKNISYILKDVDKDNNNNNNIYYLLTSLSQNYKIEPYILEFDTKNIKLYYTYYATGDIKPYFRGKLHALYTLLLPFYIYKLFSIAHNKNQKIAAISFSTGSLICYFVSSIYHCGGWKPKTEYLLQKIDHMCILLLIAGITLPYAITFKNKSHIYFIIINTIVGMYINYKKKQKGAMTTKHGIFHIIGILSCLIYIKKIHNLFPKYHIILFYISILKYFISIYIYKYRLLNISPYIFGYHESFHVIGQIGILCSTYLNYYIVKDHLKSVEM